MSQTLADPGVVAKFDTIASKYDTLRKRQEDPDSSSDEKATLGKDLARIEPTVTIYRQYRERQQEVAEIKTLMKECSAADAKENADMFNEELNRLNDELATLRTELLESLVPADISEQEVAILEVRSGTGGDEAALFADEMFRMYQRHATLAGFRFEVVSTSRGSEGTTAGGTSSSTSPKLKEGVATVTGEGVFRRFMFESGVHRVQRVPATESQGRIHTSTITVAVLAQPSKVQADIKESDLRVDVFRASGAGGQHVNTTESAVRITHYPTGIVVAIQDERSQHKNRAKAMNILRARVYEVEKSKVEKERRDTRSKLIGRGERSEKIRTYNFPKNRVTDHRINLSLYNLSLVMEGTGLAEFIDNLQARHYMDLLANLDEQMPSS
ncbi:hypothetical protein IWQ60_011010 [Tieghemiomyces parasiticus]|uniref:Prokaryotic-type class I peptide chain release factors domain-containing protein n=1 Tax=Tieghemiomyces parasiticus TaxID=78921 RepID=A0A9W7ZI68_9FUNG|nr:hypothetical protein IWQ60_011010 [Tieghemiomyces parasiticus]